MIKEPPHTISNDSITVVWEGKPYVVKRGQPNFQNLKRALVEEQWDTIADHLSVFKTVKSWSDDVFTVTEDNVLYKGQPVPSEFRARVISLASSGKSPRPLLRFWERLQKNPSSRSVNQLFPFLAHENIPITKDGFFLAYKGVTNELKDVHSRTIDNSPGQVIKIPRNQISDDPKEACHFGLHVGAVSYASNFGPRVVICKVDPENVVCVPYDCSQQKMRVCEYEVIGFYGTDLPSDVFEDDLEDMKQPASTTKAVPAKDTVSVQPATASTGTKVESVTEDAPKPVRKLSAGELMELSIDDLRKHATHDLKIVGASKIPGGKASLVATIIKVRKKS